MNFLMKLIVRYQIYRSKRKAPKICLNCNELVYPRKEISVLNVLFYLILGVVTYFIMKKIWVALLVPLVLTVINVFMVKKRCPKCRGEEFKE